MKDNNIILSGKNIVKNYGENTVLNGVNINIYKGSFTVIMGASGSGKSTLLYMLSGMDQLSGGNIDSTEDNKENSSTDSGNVLNSAVLVLQQHL